MRNFTRVASLLTTVIALHGVSFSLAGQTPPNSATARPVAAAAVKPGISSDVSLTADYIANAGDSIAAYKMLDSAVRLNKHDAAAWHRYGMMAWSMARSTRGQTLNHSSQGVRWLIAADSALHFAVTFAPDSAVYWRDLSRFYLNSGSVFVRFRAQDYVTKGLKSAVRAGDSLLTSDLADERGMILWRRYESAANTGEAPIGGATSTGVYSKEQAKHGVAVRRDQIIQPALHFTGFSDYSDAVEMFRRAVTANALNTRARHHIYMALAERKNWPELLAASAAQIARAPWDFEAYLAGGLAHQRLNHGDLAAAAFDSALVLMTPESRAEYARVTRILPPKSYGGADRFTDSTDFVKLSPQEKKSTEALFWAIVDPLAATAQNELRTEFYARVAYSDLRWTSDDLDHRGANSDRGDIHVRFGPPDLITGSTWRYNNGFSFTFNEPPTFGTGHISGDQKTVAEVAIRDNAVRWDNVPAMRLMEKLTIRTTAFRGTNDSLDVVVVTNVPAGHLAQGIDLGGDMPFTISARVIDAQVNTHGIQSAVRKFNADSIPAVLAQHWTESVGPGANIIRVEAYEPDTRRIASGFAAVTNLQPAAFGMSDVLLGNHPVEPTASPERWRNVQMLPSAGVYRVGESIGLLWENYGLKAVGGDVKYRVHINVRRDVGSGLQNLGARVRSAFTNNVLAQANGNGNIDIEFPRTAGARNVTVEAITLDMGSPPPGVFYLTVTIVDMVSGKKTERITNFQVVE